MDLQTLVPLTIGATLVTCVLAVVGVHFYARGRAQRAALVDRLSAASQVPYTGRRSALPRPGPCGCAAPGSAGSWN